MRAVCEGEFPMKWGKISAWLPFGDSVIIRNPCGVVRNHVAYKEAA
ncbi:hypothetical protein [Bartonella doshiae]|nr:hypothetical protein [Bartonella doshiae]